MTLALAGSIERRLLVNFRADPEHVESTLPSGFTPQLVGPHAIVGICLIELRVHPARLPRRCAIRSFNGAHRIAVLDPDGTPAVYVLRRDTNSALVEHAGGRIFPARHRRATVVATEAGDGLRIVLQSRDDLVHVDVHTANAARLPDDSAFRDVEHASSFFREAGIAYAPDTSGETLDAVELRTPTWAVTPQRVVHASSSHFDDVANYPAGSVVIDHALLMRDVPHTWHVRPSRRLVPRPGQRSS